MRVPMLLLDHPTDESTRYGGFPPSHALHRVREAPRVHCLGEIAPGPGAQHADKLGEVGALGQHHDGGVGKPSVDLGGRRDAASR